MLVAIAILCGFLIVFFIITSPFEIPNSNHLLKLLFKTGEQLSLKSLLGFQWMAQYLMIQIVITCKNPVPNIQEICE